MATVEFFKITIKNKKTNKEYKEVDFIKLLQTKLENISDAMKYCTHGRRSKCSASLGDYKKSKNNITFDFQKLQEERIKSALISELSTEVDLIKYTHKKELESATYKPIDIEIVRNIIQNTSLEFYEIIEKLKEISSKINKFSIYKIIIENDLDKKKDKNTLSQSFYDEVLRRFTINKTFFNIFSSEKNMNILLMQVNSYGFTFKHLEEYFNVHLLKDDKYKVFIEYIYDKDFFHILQYEKLNEFKFSLNLETPSLNKKDISPEFEELLLKYFGKTNITITVKPLDKKDSLDNKKIINFFDLARDEGLISSVKIKKKGHQKSIEAKSKGDILKFSRKTTNALDLEDAHSLFQNAIQKNLQ